MPPGKFPDVGSSMLYATVSSELVPNVSVALYGIDDQFRAEILEKLPPALMLCAPFSQVKLSSTENCAATLALWPP